MNARTSPPESPVNLPAKGAPRTVRHAARAGAALLVVAAMFSLTACTAEQRAAVETFVQTSARTVATEQGTAESPDGANTTDAPQAAIPQTEPQESTEPTDESRAEVANGPREDTVTAAESTADANDDALNGSGFDLGALVSSGVSSLVDSAVDTVAIAGVTPEFKETMDGYEAFMNEYVAFMVTYENSDDTIAMLGDFASLMQAEAAWLETIDAIDETELSDADCAYYLAVTARVTAMLYSSGVL